MQYIVETVSYTHLDVYKRQAEILTTTSGETPRSYRVYIEKVNDADPRRNICLLYTSPHRHPDRYRWRGCAAAGTQHAGEHHDADDIINDSGTDDGSAQKTLQVPKLLQGGDVYKRQELLSMIFV